LVYICNPTIAHKFTLVNLFYEQPLRIAYVEGNLPLLDPGQPQKEEGRPQTGNNLLLD
jgi:hypothetical protein